MEFIELPIEGCFVVELGVFSDLRGEFVKTFHAPSFLNSPLENFDIREEFITTSKKNVVRGLHFQEPPFAHDKVVTCSRGKVKDFFVDIRRFSSTFGQVYSIDLDSRSPSLLYLPKGIAHGFLSLEDDSTMIYKTNFEYSPEHDSGININSVAGKLGLDLSGVEISDRDKAFPRLGEYRSPF